MSNAAVARARRLFELVKQGKIVFFKAGDSWDIVGPADAIKPGATVTVNKADGTTDEVVVTQIMAERTVEGVATRTATFTRPRRTPAPVQKTPWYPVADRQAAAVGGMIGRTTAGKLGYCHYCGGNLDRHGNCRECI